MVLSDSLTRPTRGVNASAPLLSLERLERWFGEQRVLTSLDLALDAGARLAVRGPNGSGKTTLLRCLAGTLSPSAGEVLVGGFRAGTIEAKRITGFLLSQERAFYMRLSGRENLLFVSRLRHANEREAQRDVLSLEEELGLKDFAEARVNTYSTGMMQQLAFARALMGEPRLLLLDEPTRSLDIAASQRLWDALDRRYAAAVVIATHKEDDARHCGEVLHLRG